MNLELLEATNGGKPESQAMTTVVESGQTRSTQSGRFKLFTIDEVLNETPPEWRVDGVLPEGALSMVYAPQEQYKTFFALDMALSVASGTDFHGRKVKPGPIVYVLGEGRGGLRNRVLAWMQHHHVANIEGAFFVLEAVQFIKPEDVASLQKQIELLNVTPAMVFIDTFARSAVGLDENDACAVGNWIHAVTTFKDRLSADVVALHHAQKGNGNAPVRERGSSAFIGAVDSVIRLKATDRRVEVRCEKQKDAEHFEPFTLRVKIQRLDSDRGLAESCVLVDDDGGSSEHSLNDLRPALLALAGFPDGRAARKEWLPETGLAERTFDRNREALVGLGYIEGKSRGTYAITETGRLAIGDLLATRQTTSGAEDVAAIPQSRRDGVATRLADAADDATAKTDQEQ